MIHDYFGVLDNVTKVRYVAAVALALFGVAFILTALVKLARFSGEIKEAANYTGSKESRSVSAAGFIVWVLVGAVFATVSVGIFIYYIDPILGDNFRPLPRVTEQVAFKSPSGVICSTYVDRDAMACVISDQTWGQSGCTYIYTLPAKGEATIEECTGKSDYKPLSGVPNAPVRDWGNTYDFAVARCILASEGVYCVNHDEHYIRLSRNTEWPRV